MVDDNSFMNYVYLHAEFTWIQMNDSELKRYLKMYFRLMKKVHVQTDFWQKYIMLKLMLMRLMLIPFLICFFSTHQVLALTHLFTAAAPFLHSALPLPAFPFTHLFISLFLSLFYCPLQFHRLPWKPVLLSLLLSVSVLCVFLLLRGCLKSRWLATHPNAAPSLRRRSPRVSKQIGLSPSFASTSVHYKGLTSIWPF